MSEQRVAELISRLPDDVVPLFVEMIAAYQIGYADYVYQARDAAVQERRIKNMAKNFRKMDYYYLMPLSQDLAVEIATEWQYEPPYHIYDKVEDATFLSEEARGDHYFAVIRNGVLLGYVGVERRAEGIAVELGMKPAYTGQGRGRAFYEAIEAYLKEHVAPAKLSVEVSAFNQRALALFAAVGFVERQRRREHLILEKELEHEVG